MNSYHSMKRAYSNQHLKPNLVPLHWTHETASRNTPSDLMTDLYPSYHSICYTCRVLLFWKITCPHVRIMSYPFRVSVSVLLRLRLMTKCYPIFFCVKSIIIQTNFFSKSSINFSSLVRNGKGRSINLFLQTWQIKRWSTHNLSLANKWLQVRPRTLEVIFIVASRKSNPKQTDLFTPHSSQRHQQNNSTSTVNDLKTSHALFARSILCLKSDIHNLNTSLSLTCCHVWNNINKIR